MKKLLILFVLILCLSVSVFGQEGAEIQKKHNFFVGIDPLSALLTMIRVEASVPITGFVEVGAQAHYINFNWLMGIVGQTVPGNSYWLTAAGFVRLFPSQTADGFFFSGKISYLMLDVNVSGVMTTGGPLTDFAFGLDLGWRWRWWIDDNWGMILQIYMGIDRALTQESIGLGLPVIPYTGFHLGVAF